MTDAKDIPEIVELDPDDLEILPAEEKSKKQRVLKMRKGPSINLPAIGQFGPYDILGRLAMGGMAEILLARETVEGTESVIEQGRFLVVKKILPHYATEQDFVDMFLDEARIGLRLSHPNITHFYKFGEHEGSYYIAMEWVNGQPLGRVIRRARKRGGLPIPISAHLIARVADALHHAHTASSADGEPMDLIHRDVSPHNVMVSYDGNVKLLDFGIAKAEQQSHKTTAGTVKGKFSYMAPEQCMGKKIDHRIDVFALGVCLYETLTGRTLYRRDSEILTMRAIIEEPVPSLYDRMPDAPPELEKIVKKSLAKNADDRFQSASEMQDALQSFLTRGQHMVTGRRVGELMNTLFTQEINRGPTIDSTPFGSSYHVPSQSAMVEIKEAAAKAEARANAMEERLKAQLSGPLEIAPKIGGPSGTRELDMGFDVPEHGGAAGRANEPMMPAADLTAGLSGGPDFELDLPPDQRVTARPAPRTAPTAAPRVVSRPVPTSTATSSGNKGLIIGAAVAGVLLLGGLGAAFFLMQPGDEEAVVTPLPPDPSTMQGSILVASVPAGATVSVGGEELGQTPLSIPNLEDGDYEVVVSLDGYQSVTQPITITDAATETLTARLERSVDLENIADGDGRLSLETNPAGARVFLGEHDLGTTPLSNVTVPSGVLPLRFELPGGGEMRKNVLVRGEGVESTSFLDLTE